MQKDTATIPFLAPFESHGFTTLDITITHSHAGVNYFSGTRHGSGHRLSFSPCTVHVREGGFTSRESIMMSGNKWESGFYIPLDESARRNPHYIKRALLAIAPMLANIRDAFESKDGGQLQEYARIIDLRAQKAPTKAKLTATV